MGQTRRAAARYGAPLIARLMTYARKQPPEPARRWIPGLIGADQARRIREHRPAPERAGAA